MDNSRSTLLLAEQIRRGDFTGLSFAGLVRLSFEMDPNKERPAIPFSGTDINGRESQDDWCRKYVESRGGKYVDTYDEPDTSAWKRKRVKNEDGSYRWEVIRPTFDGLIRDLKLGVSKNGEHIDGAIIYDLDRLTRDHRHLEDAIDVATHHCKAFIDVSGTLDLLTSSGQDNARILVTMKGRQSADTSRRLRDKHQAMAMQGIPVGGSRPFGWQADKRTLHLIESVLLKQAALDVTAGVGLHTICRQWNAAGITTPSGHKWVRTVLKNIFLSPHIAGYRVYQTKIALDEHGNKVRGQHQALLTDEEWEDLIAVITDPARGGGAVHIGGRKYLLAGVARCALCGALMTGNADTKNNTFNYYCPGPTTGKGCGKVSISGTRLDKLITGLVLDYLGERQVEPDAKPFIHATQLQDAKDQIAELMAEYRSKRLSGAVVFPQLAELETIVKLLERERTAWLRDRAIRTPKNAIDTWPDMDTDGQRLVIESVLYAVTIEKSAHRGGKFDPNRVETVWR